MRQAEGPAEADPLALTGCAQLLEQAEQAQDHDDHDDRADDVEDAVHSDLLPLALERLAARNRPQDQQEHQGADERGQDADRVEPARVEAQE